MNTEIKAVTPPGAASIIYEMKIPRIISTMLITIDKNKVTLNPLPN